MSGSANVALVRRLYDSHMAPEVISEIMAPDLVWDITPGMPAGGVYYGWESVGRDFFGRLAPQFDSFSTSAEMFYGDDEDQVFVYGHYHATPKGGSEVHCRFIHQWTVRDEKLAHLVQVADSHILQAALAGDS